MTTTTDAAARLRSEVERVKGRHQPRMWRTDAGPMPMSICSCGQSIPCDAVRLAGVVEILLTTLEQVENRLSYLQEFLQGPDRRFVITLRTDMDAALAAAAARMEAT